VHQPSLADLVGQYYAVQNEELIPQCVVQPETAEQVSRVVTVLKELECIFAVKSGGHSMIPGSSSIENGVLVDLSRMNSLELAEDESTVSIGPGARWGDVYLALEERGLLVVGGRVSSVGVGGLTLGGTLIDLRDNKKAELYKVVYLFSLVFMEWLVTMYEALR